MSVTMVATHVQSLEERLGVRLLNRTTRKVSLTETGKFYYDRSAQILADLDEADRAAGALTTTPRGVLKFNSTAAVVRFLLPVMDEFMQLYPSVSLDLSISERMVDMIEDGYDLSIRTVPSPDSSLIVRKLTPWRHILVCSPSYLEAQKPPLTLADLAGHDCTRYTYYPFGDEWTLETEEGERSQVRVSGSVVTNSAETLRYLAVNGRAVSLAPSFLVSEDLAEGRLVRLLPEYRGVEFAINAVYPNRSHLPSKVRLFIDLLAERFVEHRKWMT
jgi:DNA-binding transcriptional LysR family regulator